MITVNIPSESASRSKMQKKGWKCWAKILTSVKSPANDGFAFEGQFVTAGTTVEVEPGDVILHCDQSASADIGVAYAQSNGKGAIRWLKSADSEGRKWCATLGQTARKLLALAADERLKQVAVSLLDSFGPDKNPAVRAYYERLADREPVATEPVATEPVATDDQRQVIQNAISAKNRATRDAEEFMRLHDLARGYAYFGDASNDPASDPELVQAMDGIMKLYRAARAAEAAIEARLPSYPGYEEYMAECAKKIGF